MSEMSLYEQIRALDEVIEYIEVTIPGDVNYINDKVANNLAYLRQHGLRTEIIETVNGKMGHINHELEGLIKKMNIKDITYLSDIREHLYRAGSEQ